MRKLIFVLFLAVLAVPSMAQHADAQLKWYTNVMEAQQASKASHKPIFGFFTGSDWCGWCHKLQADVFAKPAFVKWAKENVILLELDFPKRKQLSPELTQQNNSLAQAFQVQGYPTVWYFTMTQDTANKMVINALGQQGYPSGAERGKEEVTFLNNANGIIAKYTGK